MVLFTENPRAADLSSTRSRHCTAVVRIFDDLGSDRRATVDVSAAVEEDVSRLANRHLSASILLATYLRNRFCSARLPQSSSLMRVLHHHTQSHGYPAL